MILDHCIGPAATGVRCLTIAQCRCPFVDHYMKCQGARHLAKVPQISFDLCMGDGKVSEVTNAMVKYSDIFDLYMAET